MPDLKRGKVRTLAVVLGDQLDADSPALRGLDAARDGVLMMEVEAESTHVPSHVQRSAVFLSAMRHFASGLRGRGLRVRYVSMDDPSNTQSFDGEVARAAAEHRPERLVLVHPGEWRVLMMARSWGRATGATVDILEDTHFLTSLDGFSRWARGRRQPIMEFFYREQRRRLGILVDERGEPEGGAWNFDADNRRSFGRGGPGRLPRAARFEPDATTRDVLEMLRRRLPDLPGGAESFGWPVTRAQALEALDDFIRRRLENFGPYEDAMWEGEPHLYHSLLSVPLNLKLLHPRECVDAALAAYRAGRAPLQSVEGFVRQIIGWREFIRGIYWHEGEKYGERNALGAEGSLPDFYWTGRTDMNCLRVCVGEVLSGAFGHHIQRLMVTGNFAMLAGVHPRAVSDWYLGMYADAVDWVTLPNTLGMSQHADGGVVGTKPYAASGAYIHRMSNYCGGCRFDPSQRTGPRACPVTVLFWDFLARHRERFATNPRMKMMVKNLDRLPHEQVVEITASAAQIRREIGVER